MSRDKCSLNNTSECVGSNGNTSVLKQDHLKGNVSRQKRKVIIQLKNLYTFLFPILSTPFQSSQTPLRGLFNVPTKSGDRSDSKATSAKRRLIPIVLVLFRVLRISPADVPGANEEIYKASERNGVHDPLRSRPLGLEPESTTTHGDTDHAYRLTMVCIEK